jgi:hypothetical protein
VRSKRMKRARERFLSTREIEDHLNLLASVA